MMLADTPVAKPDTGSNTNLNPTYPHGSSSLLRRFLALTPSSDADIENATGDPMHASHDGRALEVNPGTIRAIRGCDDPALSDNWIPMVQLPKTLSLEMLHNRSLTALPTVSATIGHVSDTRNRPFSNLVKRCSVSEDGPVCEGTTAGPPPNEGPVIMPEAAPPLHRRALASLTMHDELSAARIPEEFGSVHMRLQQEWTFNGNFLVGLAAVNAAMFAVTTDSPFKVDTHVYTAVAISSSACGLGIAFNVWFLLRYSWVDLGTFIRRSHDVYGSFVFFSLSSRIPTFCMLISSISLMSFLGLIAYDAKPTGVLVIGVLIILVMFLQFIVYGTHRCATLALQFWRFRMVRASEVGGS